MWLEVIFKLKLTLLSTVDISPASPSSPLQAEQLLQEFPIFKFISKLQNYLLIIQY